MSAGSMSRHHASGGVRWNAWLRTEWKPVLFVVCLVTLLEMGHLLGPASSLSSIIVSNLATPASTHSVAAARAERALVIIDDDRFKRVYAERTPLNRCKLRDDLLSILEQQPQVVAIDFDLSPLHRPSAAEVACQERLDDMLDGHDAAVPVPQRTKLVLVRPLAASDGGARDRPAAAEPGSDAADRWVAGRRDAGVVFADSRLGLELSFATKTRCDPRGFAEAVYDAYHGTGLACEREEMRHDQTLNYTARLREFAWLSVDSPGLENLRTGAIVFFGGTYARDDLHNTPIGRRYGVEVHAARYATLIFPRPHRLFVSAFSDLLFAAVFSIAVFVAVHAYADYARDPSPWVRHRRSLVVVVFVVVYVGLVMAALFVAPMLLRYGVVTEPVLIALGLAFDGFVVAPWRHLGTAHAAGRAATLSSLPEGWRVDPVGAACFVLGALVFWGVIAAAVAFLAMSAF